MSFLTSLPRDRLLIDASLWSADLGALAAELDRISAHVDLFHVDASDTRFIPRPMFFPDLVRALRPRTTVPFHVHLMAHEPAGLAEQFADAGADLITVHIEVDGVDEALRRVHAAGVAAGIAINLTTPIGPLSDRLADIDAVTLVGTPLGTRGTQQGPEATARMDQARRLLDAAGAAAVPVFADGGIRQHTVAPLAGAGASGVVAGSLLFSSDDPVRAAAWLRSHRPGRHAADRP